MNYLSRRSGNPSLSTYNGYIETAPGLLCFQAAREWKDAVRRYIEEAWLMVRQFGAVNISR